MKANKTSAIMNHLRENGPVSSAHIAAALPGVRTKDVTALLKKQMARGQVIRSSGLLSINPSWDDRLVEARRLLLQSGYTVYEPGSRPVAECDLLRAAIRRLCNIYVIDDYYMGDLREERLDAAVGRAIEAVQEATK